MTIVAIIPARGGSKRFPRKNIYNLKDKPMMAYPIAAATESNLFDNIIVSTEDDEIAKIANYYGATVINRPVSLAQDRSSVVEVCSDILERNNDIQLLCCIYATAVLLKPQTLISGYELLNSDEKIDFVMGVSQYEHPPVQALKPDSNGFLTYMWPEWKGIQSQFYPEQYVSNGTFYWARRDSLIREQTFYGGKMKGWLVPKEQVSDINSIEDLPEVLRKLDI
ncbi:MULTISPECIES: acylneuraminate cytidylyltransferase family protein [unclassified Polaromonas]|jgi:CMP-N-acetylneuraminic acid synthetase|uniref:acylneuraminate cytidylyltransferase family protein n=1 Tax=unclassified Polaromonas TaxID=2638319 RepID=UPI000BD247DB|nr:MULTISPECIES: acylneuraminate cytidylyltransferase family protein [unclassified Polaromonas]OYZ76270.1 MAG: hypothetical protein B7Y09_21175 [Polaromonas sp. 24-63-21]OZA47490.1 MAG: hypothetical protein B7X88_21885 [Polaromonas sp. 17-63-33]